jgi:hypothetical protein
VTASLLFTPAPAQGGLCSARCFVDPQTGQPYCGLSMFGQNRCFDGVDWCAEFACDMLTPSTPETVAAKDLFQPIRAGQCRLASSILTQDPEEKVQVARLEPRI